MRPARALAALLAAGLAAVAALPASAEPAMWTVKDKDSTVYLFGTVHLLRPEKTWMTPRLRAALDSCQDLTLEIVDNEPAAMADIITRYGLDPDRRLLERLAPADRARLEAAAADLGVPIERFAALRPWLAGLQLTLGAVTRAGYDPNAGVESILKADARAQGEPIGALETAEAQIALLAGLPEDIQLAFLAESLDQYARAGELLDEMADAWAEGDEKTLNRLINEDMRRVSEPLYQQLIVGRNVGMAEGVRRILAGKGISCVAVGAGHLVGPDSVQAQLAKAGVRAKRF